MAKALITETKWTMNPETKAKMSKRRLEWWAQKKAAEAAELAPPTAANAVTDVPSPESESAPGGRAKVIEVPSIEEAEAPFGTCSQGQNQVTPEQSDHIEPSTLLGDLEHQTRAESIKNQLRSIWHSGNQWRLEFGRLLLDLREEIDHGEWIKFLETEFGLHRQTARNWMRKAADADGISVDEPQTNDDESDPHAEEVETKIAEEAARVEDAKNKAKPSGSTPKGGQGGNSTKGKVKRAKKIVKLNVSKPIHLVLDAATTDEGERYEDELDRNYDWVQGILRQAFDKIIAGKPEDAD